MQETLHTHNSEKIASQDSYDTLESATEGSEGKEEMGGKETTSKENLLKNWPLMSSVIVYCVFSLHDMAYTEVNNINAFLDICSRMRKWMLQLSPSEYLIAIWDKKIFCMWFKSDSSACNLSSSNICLLMFMTRLNFLLKTDILVVGWESKKVRRLKLYHAGCWNSACNLRHGYSLRYLVVYGKGLNKWFADGFVQISGFGLLVFQSSIYPPLEKIMGPIRLCRILGVRSLKLHTWYLHGLDSLYIYSNGLSSILQIMSIPLLTSYHYIAMLSGITLSIVLNCASLLKNVLSVSDIFIPGQRA